MKAAIFALGLIVVVASGLQVSVADGAPAGSQRSGALRPNDKSPKKLTDLQIKKLLIEESIASYPGNCPCPYNAARNGLRCGGRSAWSRAGGAEPLCYPNDVSAEMVQDYRDAHPGA